MNFFKSIILDDPEPPKPESPRESDPDSADNPPEEDRNSNAASEGGDVAGWSFGSLIKTIATRSESVIETYSRDLKEFGSGLRQESEIIREAASRAVKELPASLEAGTSAAQGVLDGVLKSTAEIIAKETQFSDGESEAPEMNRSLNSGRYSRFEAQLSGIQSDLNTFCEEPDDLEDYEKWRSSFKLEEKRGEIEGFIGENGVLDANFRKVVPNVVDHDTFWCRYFYRVDKLEQQEKFRANLVKRAISADEDDDELSWDVDDEEEKDDEKAKDASDVSSIPGEKGGSLSDGPQLEKGSSICGEKGGSSGDGSQLEKGGSILGEKGGSVSDGSQLEKEDGIVNVDDGVKKDLVEKDEALDERETKTDEVAEVRSDERLKSEESIKGKNDENVGVDEGETGEKGEVAAVSKHEVKTEEEDMGWDEIEDIGSDNEKKVSTSERPNREELRKKLSAAEDDEDLSWDIEDDDEPLKS